MGQTSKRNTSFYEGVCFLIAAAEQEPKPEAGVPELYVERSQVASFL